MKPITLDSVDADLVTRVAVDTARRFNLSMPPSLQAAWRIDSPYSTVWCLGFATSGWQHRVFVKSAHPSAHLAANRAYLRAQLKTEHDILRQLAASAVSTREAASVEPLALYVDLPALATLEARGSTLRHDYAHHARWLGGRRRREALLRRCALAGSWLGRFQDATVTGRGPFPVDALLAYCDLRLQRLTARHSRQLGETEAARLREAVHRLAAAIPGTGLELCGRHNDFASHNLIAHEGGGIRVLDFQSFDHGPAAFDACNFWYELELLKYDVSYRTGLLTRMQHVFLDAYGRIDPSDPAFQLARLRYAINRLLNELESTKKAAKVSWRRHRCIQGTLEWLRRFPARP